jgi:hypothetical protein
MGCLMTRPGLAELPAEEMSLAGGLKVIVQHENVIYITVEVRTGDMNVQCRSPGFDAMMFVHEGCTNVV